MDIDPRHLRILLSIAEQGSFTRAAAAQRISQPAMSAGIALLEKQLGVRVLERGRHGARLNAFGDLLVRHARGLNALLDQAKAEIDLKRLKQTLELKAGMKRTASPFGIGVYRTTDKGKTWDRLDKGLPEGAPMESVREGMHNDRLDPMGLYFGTANGDVWASKNEGEGWSRIAQYLPYVTSVHAATIE